MGPLHREGSLKKIIFSKGCQWCLFHHFRYNETTSKSETKSHSISNEVSFQGFMHLSNSNLMDFMASSLQPLPNVKIILKSLGHSTITLLFLIEALFNARTSSVYIGFLWVVSECNQHNDTQDILVGKYSFMQVAFWELTCNSFQNAIAMCMSLMIYYLRTHCYLI